MDRLLELNLESLKLGLLTSARYHGKPLIIFNSASFCGYTNQLEQFEKIFRQGSAVPIAIPTNDFGKQEPGDNYEILQYYRNKFDVTFPVCKKTDIGHPFFAKHGEPKWNFTKWLFDKDHKFVKRFDSKVSPHEVVMYE